MADIGYIADQTQLLTGTNAGFGQLASVRYRGQSFTPTASVINGIGFQRNVGSRGVKVYIDTAESNNHPTNPVGSELYSFVIPVASLSAAFTIYPLPVPLSVTPGQKYCFYLAPWNTGSDVYADDYQDMAHRTGTSYAGGNALINTAGTWAVSDSGNLDLTFGVYSPYGDDIALTESVGITRFTPVTPLSISKTETISLTDRVHGEEPLLDSVSSSNTTNSILTIPHTVGSLPKRALFVAVTTTGPVLADRDIASVTYGGVALTKYGNTISTTDDTVSSAYYYTFSPPSGLADVVINTVGTVWIAGTVVSWSGVETFEQGAYATSTLQYPSMSRTITYPNTLLLHFVSSKSPRTGLGTGQTSLSTIQGPSSTDNSSSSYKVVPNPSTSAMQASFAAALPNVLRVAHILPTRYVVATNPVTPAPSVTESTTVTEAITVSVTSPPPAISIGVGGGLAGAVWRGIDTMKDHKDNLTEQVPDAFITAKIAAIKNNFNVTHVGIAIPMDKQADFIYGKIPAPRTIIDLTQKWADAVHNEGLKVLWRGAWCGEEGIWNFPRKVGSNRISQGSPWEVLGTSYTDSFTSINGRYWRTNHQSSNTWTISNGELRGPTAPTGFNSWRNTIIFAPYRYTNLVAQVKVKKVGTPMLAIRTGTDSNNTPGYGFQLRDNEFRLERPGLASLSSVSFPTTTNQYYQIKAEATGSTIRGKVWVHGTTEPTSWMISVTDTTYASGYVALGAETSNPIFDDFILTPAATQNSWIGKTYRYIVDNPTFFRAGDLWGPMPELTGHGMFSDNTSFLPHDGLGIQLNLTNFLLDMKYVSELAFAAIGLANVVGNSNELYVNPNSQLATHVATLSPSTKKTRLNWVANMPTATWSGIEWDPECASVSTLAAASTAQNKWGTVVAYSIPGRDLGSYSAGGADSAAEYTTWWNKMITAVGNAKIIMIYEPDALPQSTDQTALNKAERYTLMRQSIIDFKAGCPNAKIYVDCAHSSWKSASEVAFLLQQIDGHNADGFSCNVSNFRPDAEIVPWAQAVCAALPSTYSHYKFVYDTSRNGNTVAPPASLYTNPANRQFGKLPQYGITTIDKCIGHLWIKAPGESDGANASGVPAAGELFVTYLYNDSVGDNVTAPDDNTSRCFTSSGMCQREPGISLTPLPVGAQTTSTVICGMTTLDYGGTYENQWINSLIPQGQGHIVIDHYGRDVGTSNPTTHVANMTTDYNLMASRWPGIPVFHQEYSDHWNGSLTEVPRSAFIRAILDYLSTKVTTGQLKGFNWWGGWTGGTGEGIFTQTGPNSAPTFGLNYKGTILQSYFQNGISESTTLTESTVVSIAAQSTYQVNTPVDTIFTDETVTVKILTSISVNDSTTVTENTVVNVFDPNLPRPVVTDSTTVSESTTVNLLIAKSVFDATTVTENISVARVTVVQIYAFESALVEELVDQSTPPGLISVTDETALEESFTVDPTDPLITSPQATSNSQANGTSSLTWSHTISGENRMLIVAPVAQDNDTNGDEAVVVESVTFNGLPLTRITYASTTVNSHSRVGLWYLNNPPLGTYDITIEWAEVCQAVIGMAASFIGADTNSEIIDFNSNVVEGDTTPTVSVTTRRLDSFVISAVVNASESDPLNTTDLTLQNVTNAGFMRAGLSLKGPIETAQTVDVSWSKTGPESWAIAAAVIKPPIIWKNVVQPNTSWSDGAQSSSTWTNQSAS